MTDTTAPADLGTLNEEASRKIRQAFGVMPYAAALPALARFGYPYAQIPVADVVEALEQLAERLAAHGEQATRDAHDLRVLRADVAAFRRVLGTGE